MKKNSIYVGVVDADSELARRNALTQAERDAEDAEDASHVNPTTEPHTLPGETPQQRTAREKGTADEITPRVSTPEGEARAREAELARVDLEAEKARTAITDRDSQPIDTAAASIAHSLSIANATPKVRKELPEQK